MAATTTAPPGDAIKRRLPWLVAVAFFMQALDTTALGRGRDLSPYFIDAVVKAG